MDVSAQTIRQVEFREKLRGYHQDDVDEFLERVAAGVEILQERLRVATERAVRAEQQATESRADDESLRRTLVLAQRTADLAVQEGREEAERMVEQARAEASAIVAAAEEDAHRAAGDADAQLRADVERLEGVRLQLQHDVDRLVRYIDEQRARFKAVLEQAARDIDDALTPAPVPPPGDAPEPEWPPAPAPERSAVDEAIGGAEAVDAGDVATDADAGGAALDAPAGTDALWPR